MRTEGGDFKELLPASAARWTMEPLDRLAAFNGSEEFLGCPNGWLTGVVTGTGSRDDCN
jgi:hypothetical protein